MRYCCPRRYFWGSSEWYSSSNVWFSGVHIDVYLFFWFSELFGLIHLLCLRSMLDTVIPTRDLSASCRTSTHHAFREYIHYTNNPIMHFPLTDISYTLPLDLLLLLEATFKPPRVLGSREHSLSPRRSPTGFLRNKEYSEGSGK